MKVTFDIECTPEEARQFLGLPNIAPLQDRMMQEIEEKMRENIQSLDPETFVRTWLPATIQGWTDLQKMFWSQMGQTMPGMPGTGASSDTAEKKSKK